MKLRNWINHNSLPVTCGSLAMLVGSLYYLQATMSPPIYKPPTTAFFYDTVTSELFAGKIDDIPPIATPAASYVNDRPAGVRAHVFSCSSCQDVRSRFIGYIENFTEEAREAQIKINLQFTQPEPAHETSSDSASPAEIVMSPNQTLLTALDRGHMVATTSAPDTWINESSEQGSNLIAAAINKCAAGQFPMQCLPDDK
jgi:hypothetical protein